MRRFAIDDAKSAAERFLSAVEALEAREQSDAQFRRFMSSVGFRETAAVRRASMDLTRALSEMRKSA